LRRFGFFAANLGFRGKAAGNCLDDTNFGWYGRGIPAYSLVREAIATARFRCGRRPAARFLDTIERRVVGIVLMNCGVGMFTRLSGPVASLIAGEAGEAGRDKGNPGPLGADGGEARRTLSWDADRRSCRRPRRPLRASNRTDLPAKLWRVKTMPERLAP
jgi:hypothetical protein